MEKVQSHSNRPGWSHLKEKVIFALLRGSLRNMGPYTQILYLDAHFRVYTSTWPLHSFSCHTQWDFSQYCLRRDLTTLQLINLQSLGVLKITLYNSNQPQAFLSASNTWSVVGLW